MNFDAFDAAKVQYQHNGHADDALPYPTDLSEVLSPQACNTARQVISGWDGYAPSQLRALDGLAGDIGVASLLYKDESSRFGLGSFKALGGAYCVLRLLAREIPNLGGGVVSDAAIGAGQCADVVKDITVVTATDGNHGRSVAWGARNFGCKCFIYMHAGVSKGRAKAVEDLGATVVWVDGNYDDSVHQAAKDAADNGWFVVSDTSYEGYMDLPRHVMAGYSVMTAEVAEQLPSGETPTHVFVQGGCGGLAGAVCAHLWQTMGATRPRFVIVEPDTADCLYLSAKNEKQSAVYITEESIMAGLSCGEVSTLGWQILSRGCNDFLTITDDLVAPVMCALADGVGGDAPLVAGESAIAGLAGLIAARRNVELSAALGLDENSRVLVFGTEGATDPTIYRELVGRDPADIAA